MSPIDDGMPQETAEALDDAPESIRDYAQDAIQGLKDAVEQGRELILRYPALTVAGAMAGGWLFAKFVARRR